MDKLLVLSGQDPIVSMEAGKYAIWLIPLLFSYAILETMVPYLQTQSLILPMLLYAQLSLSLFTYLFVGPYNYFTALSHPIFYRCCCKVLLSIAVSLRENASLTYNILTVFLSLFLVEAFMCISASITEKRKIYHICSTRLSNELGAGNPRAAQPRVCTVMVLSVAEGIMVSATLFCCRSILGYAYSAEKEVVDYVREMTPLLYLSIIMDSLTAILSDIEWMKLMRNLFEWAIYYVNNDYEDAQLREEPPAKVLIDKVQRDILSDKLRVSLSTLKTVKVEYKTLRKIVRLKYEGRLSILADPWPKLLMILSHGTMCTLLSFLRDSKDDPFPGNNMVLVTERVDTHEDAHAKVVVEEQNIQIHPHIVEAFMCIGAYITEKRKIYHICSTRVSNELGAGNPRAAQLSVCTVMVLAVAEAIMVSATLFCCCSILGYGYSGEKEVVDYVREMTRLLCLSIIMDSLTALLSDIEWKLTYVDETYDQVLESVVVGPVNIGNYRFVFEADPPDPSKIREDDIIGVTVLLLTCSYLGQEFIRVGYHVNKDYEDVQLREEPPAKVLIDKVQRDILSDKPRVTKFPINFHSENSESGVQDPSQDCQAQVDGNEEEIQVSGSPPDCDAQVDGNDQDEQVSASPDKPSNGEIL
ncbi:hypothetical protein RHSIM_Rhsim10G0074400 [Rhododendron simsii]|uniref:Protein DETOXIFICATION n=1 Tax=Rhododendron simsii TaxID=118357 RepID=A0A834LDP0_RHOSS|nr:hypothetical protein RHSIM_Rhsim10G0074400 [Rhododendron simsii]